MPEPFRATVRIQRNPDGSLPHVGLGGPARSMYPGGNTLDEDQILADAAARMISAMMHEEGHDEREPIRVQAEVGRPVPEVEAS